MKKSFSWRMLTSFGLFLSLFVLLASGVILYAFQAGTGTGFIPEFAGLTKPAWLQQHIMFGYLFALLSLYHLFIVNREVFISYLKKQAADGKHRRAELLATVLLTAVVAIGTHTGMQPFSGLLNIGRETPSSVQGIEFEEPVTASFEERHHHHDHDGDREAGREARPIAYREDSREVAADASLDSGRGYNDNRSGDSGAPDDELHRRTTASCASCH